MPRKYAGNTVQGHNWENKEQLLEICIKMQRGITLTVKIFVYIKTFHTPGVNAEK